MTWQINLEQTRSGLLIQSLLVIVIRNNSNTGIETSLNFLPSSETFTGNVFSYVCVCVCWEWDNARNLLAGTNPRYFC